MSSLPLIRFRNFDAQLTDNEFFNAFAKSVGRELITKLLFNHFKNNPNGISTITNIQSDIINTRDANQQQILSHDCIDTLPPEIISECASYLNYKQYFQFAKCNRKLYIACYTFPSIQELYLNGVTRHAMSEFGNVNLNAFKNIQNLIMEITDFNALSASNKKIWSNNTSLHTLTLNADGCNENDIISFINNQHLINYNNITTLTLRCCRFRSELIYDILSQFAQLQNLQLYVIGMPIIRLDNNSNLTDKDEIKKWFPNMRSLVIVDTNTAFASNMIGALHNSLESLEIRNATIVSTLNARFPKLQSLELTGNLHLLKMPLMSLKHVTLLSFDEAVIHTFIENTICKQLTVENVTIYSQDVNSFSILQKIESILAKNRNIERKCKRLRIVLIFLGNDPFDDDKNLFGLQIFRISNALKLSVINNWCLEILHNSPNFNKENLQNELNEMKRNYFLAYEIKENKVTIVVKGA